MPVRTLLIDNYDRRVSLLSRSSVRSCTEHADVPVAHARSYTYNLYHLIAAVNEGAERVRFARCAAPPAVAASAEP